MTLCEVKFYRQKVKYIIKFQLQSKFQRLLYKTLCVFSQIKERKHIEWIFILLPGSCPRVLQFLGFAFIFLSLDISSSLSMKNININIKCQNVNEDI